MRQMLYLCRIRLIAMSYDNSGMRRQHSNKIFSSGSQLPVIPALSTRWRLLCFFILYAIIAHSPKNTRYFAKKRRFRQSDEIVLPAAVLYGMIV